MTAALLLIDIQNDYFPGGNMECEGSVAATTNAARLLADFRHRGLPAIHVQHLMTRPNAGYLMPGTHGAEIHAAVAPLPGETVVVKNHPNSFRATGLRDHLEALGVDRLVVAGMMTHMCIDSTVRAACDFGYKITLAHDACATRTLALRDVIVPAAQVHASFISALHGLFAEAKTTAEILA